MARVSKRLRFEIFRRDNHTCRYCGRAAPEVALTIDHVVPEVLGGKTEPDNLVAACADCNSGKTSLPPDAPLVEDVRQDAWRWARAMEIAAQGQRAERSERDQVRRAFYDVWSYGDGKGEKQAFPLPVDWTESIDAFTRAGLNMEDILDAADKAIRKTTVQLRMMFRYFCGICWRMLDDRRETAAAIVDLVSEDEADR
jgi:hypothetical protein